ncbi:MAG: hypothetical protein VYC67_02110 [Pseudomonadota bacterium]|nr:hypothetical protein [Pseudomonadota bacterium]
MLKLSSQFQNQSPIAKFILALSGILTLGLMMFLGVIAFIIVGGFLILISILMAVRFWWIKRKIIKYNESNLDKANQKDKNAQAFEGEYHEIDK